MFLDIFCIIRDPYHGQDPFVSDEDGWTRDDYYITGCSKYWISLRLVDEFGEIFEESSEGDGASEFEGLEAPAFSDTEEDVVSDAEEGVLVNETVSEDTGEVFEQSLDAVVSAQETEEVHSVVCPASSTCTSIESIKCYPVHNTPELDGYSDEWENVKVYEAPLTGALCPSRYPHGNGSVQIQCVHDAEKIYFLTHVPGPYRSSSEENRKNAAMSVMFKMGETASLSDMVSALPITCGRITL